MKQESLFQNNDVTSPLASRIRPRTLKEYVGQKHILGEGKVLYNLIEKDMVSSMIFWGPPGVGKTTLARIIAHKTQSHFINFSAVTSGIKEIKTVMKEAEEAFHFGRKTIVFIDEIHRFNKAQQDAFLPYVEKGSIILIGATTENPSFEVNSALLSRCKVFVLKALGISDIVELLQNALHDERGFKQQKIFIEKADLEKIAVFSNGDARMALNTLEMVVNNGDWKEDGIYITNEVLQQCITQKTFLYDRQGEEHYNLISALHKSMRNSDVDASIYWLSRMLEAGEDPLYIARRLVRFASEDIGMADSRALEICIAVYQACHFLGMPECSVHLTHAVTYLSLSPKSNALYIAYGKASEDAKHQLKEPVPLHLRNAPTALMKELHYGEGYEYAHDHESKITAMECMPSSLKDKTYYYPTMQGNEKRAAQRLHDIKEWKKNHRNKQ